MSTFFKKASTVILSAIGGATVTLSAVKFSPTVQAALNPKLTDDNRVGISEGLDDIIDKHRDIRNQFDLFFDDTFFTGIDPFEDMKEIRERIEKKMKLDSEYRNSSNPFDSWYSGKFGGGDIYDISKKEDDQFVYYEVRVPNLESSAVEAKVENGQISISGKIENSKDLYQENDSSEGHSYVRSGFTRSFPLPVDVEEDKMEMQKDKDKLVIKFPKISA